MQFFKVSIAAALATAVAAQNNTVIPCCTVPVSQVPQDTRQEWCNAQQNTCVDICGGQGQIASNGNNCDASTLDYKCSCNNGTTISDSAMKTYQQTVPAQMCYFWYNACINATIGANGEGNAAEQFQCTQARNSQCGNTTFDESSDGSSSQASSTSSSSGGASRTSSAASGSAAAATGSSKPSSGAELLHALGTPVLAGGLLAFFGLAL